MFGLNTLYVNMSYFIIYYYGHFHADSTHIFKLNFVIRDIDCSQYCI